jgi:ankyrin repeat protein
MWQLLCGSASVNTVISDDLSPLQFALIYGHAGAVRLLLELGANAIAPSAGAEQQLMLAAWPSSNNDSRARFGKIGTQSFRRS